MKTFLCSLLAAILLVPAVAFGQAAQTATPTQQVATRQDSCVGYSTVSGAPQQTLTITPPAGMYVYVCYVEVVSVATTAVAAVAALTHTSTNLNGFKMFDFFPAATGVVKTTALPGMAPLKSSQPGLAVTIVTNAAVTNITYNVSAWYYFAP